jgi:hypothetical protein
VVAKFLACLVLVVMVGFTGLAHQESERKPSGHSFSFRPGQPLYIATLRRNVGRGHEITDTNIGLGHDLDIEKRVRKEIEAQKVFKIVDKPSEAEFVFLVHVDASIAEALVLLPETYRQYKDRPIDLDTLREAAYGRYTVGPYLIPRLAKISTSLVEKFHQEVRKAGKQRTNASRIQGRVGNSKGEAERETTRKQAGALPSAEELKL